MLICSTELATPSSLQIAAEQPRLLEGNGIQDARDTIYIYIYIYKYIEKLPSASSGVLATLAPIIIIIIIINFSCLCQHIHGASTSDLRGFGVTGPD